MHVSVFGLGYVGCVSAACLARDGHTVIGVDIDSRKVADVNAGRSPFWEPGLESLLQGGRTAGLLSATTDEVRALEATEVALICVGTPSERMGEINLSALRGVLQSIGMAIRTRTTPLVVVLRSTVLPKVVERDLIPLLERTAERPIGSLIDFCYNPEFLREGSAIRDFYEAPMVVIGHSGGWGAAAVAELYRKVDAPTVFTDIGTACMVKYACNAFHALKVSFANEVGQLSEMLEVDGWRVMELVCMDKKLNISPVYMKPGFAFGGSCLPKDLRALVAESRKSGLHLPVLQGILPSNRAHLESCLDSIVSAGVRSVGLFGLTFKEDTDDLRESPAVELAERLLGKGIGLTVYEPAISQSTIHGANRSFLERSIPHIWRVLTPDLQALLDSESVVLLKKPDAAELEVLNRLRSSQLCFDFTGTMKDRELAAHKIVFGTARQTLEIA
jgi:GDP-mannose 6-dehydrogenase